MENSFLRRFLEMRAKVDGAAPVSKSRAAQSGQEITFSDLCRDKPSSKVVIEYFRRKVDEMIQQDLENE